MKGMPLPFEFEGKGVLELDILFNKNSSILNSWNNHNNNSTTTKESCYFVNSPSAVLDTIRSPRPITSSSTLSSSLGGGGGGDGTASTDTAGGGGGGGGGVAAVSANPSSKWQQQQQLQQDNTTATSSNVGGAEFELQQVQTPSLEMGAAAATGGGEKCAMEEWEGGLSESVMASPCQEQSILRWIMGDVDDPSMANLNKVLQVSGPGEYEFNGGFGVVDQRFGVDPVGQIGSFMPAISSSSSFSNTRMNSDKIGLVSNPPPTNLPQNPIFPALSNNLGPVAFGQTQQQPFESTDLKPHSFNSQFLINQHQTQIPQNPSFLLPLPFAQQEQNLVLPPQAKRHNPGTILEPGSQISKGLFLDAGHQQPTPSQGLAHQLQLLPHFRPGAIGTKPKMVGEEMGQFHQLQQQQQQQQQAIIDQLFKAAELVQTGNPVLAQGILARLNHQLSPIGKPFYRAAFYCKEALQLLLHANTNNLNPSMASSSPFSLIFKIGAYKSFSEISPVAQFSNFTCNQALLEVLDGFERIHIVDFDIGYGGQWASLMQELALRSGGAPTLKITALASPSTHDQLELGLTRENLIHFASEINMAFEFEILSIDSLNSTSWSLPPLVSENEAIAVNLPVSSLSSYQLSLPLVLHFVKQLSPRIVVSVDRGCDRTDLPFPNHVIQALQSFSNLLESLDAVNVNFDALQKIERFLLQPGIERIVMGRFRSPEKTQHWRALFLSSGFSPLSLSNFTESQAECVVKRTPVRGFHVEKRQSSLVLCWQRKELISASAWRC